MLKIASAVVAIIAALATAAPARAARTPYGVTTGGRIELIGSDVVYQAGTGDHRPVETRIASPGGSVRILYRTPGPPLDRFIAARSAASSTHVAVSSAVADPCNCHAQYILYDGHRLDVGPLAGPHEQPPGFCGANEPTQPELEGSRLAFVTTCFGPERARALVVRDLATDTTLFELEGESIEGIRIAGPYVAVRMRGRWRFGDVVVFDYEARREVYRVPAGSSGQFDVQADGKVVTSTSYRQDLSSAGPVYGGCSVVEWASPSEPFEHTLPGPVCARDQLRMAADRIAFVESHGPTAYPPTYHAVSDLAGNVALIASPAGGSWDFDGTRMAYTRRPCIGDEGVYLDDLSAPLQVDPVDCRMVIQRGPFRIGRDGRFRVRVGCPDGCTGGVVVTGPPARGGRRLFEGRRDVQLHPGQNAVLQVRLSAAARQQLAHRRSIPLVVGGQTIYRNGQQISFERRDRLIARSRR